MTTPLDLATNRREDGTVVLRAAGELDLSNVDLFTQALAEAIDGAPGAAAVTVDLSDIEYLDSSAINVLFTHADQLGGIIINPILRSVVTFSGLPQLVAVEAPVGPDSPSEDPQ